MSDGTELEAVLRRACLLVDSRAAHASGAPGAHARTRIEGLREDLIRFQNRPSAADPTVAHYLRAMHAVLETALDPRAPCALRERRLLSFSRELASLILYMRTGLPGADTEIEDMLTQRWTASLLAWSEVFPAGFDTEAGSCACGMLTSRNSLAERFEAAVRGLGGGRR